MKQMLWLGEAHDRHKQVKHILIWRKWMQSRESVLGGVRGDGVQVQRQDVLGWWAARTLIPWCLSWGGVTDSRTPSDIKFHRSSSLLCKMAHAQSLSHVWLLLPFMDCSLPDSSVHRILQARILEWVAMPYPGDLPDPGIEPESPASPALQADSLLLSHWWSPTSTYSTYL